MRFTINRLGSIGLLFAGLDQGATSDLGLPQSYNIASFEIVVIEPQSAFID